MVKYLKCPECSFVFAAPLTDKKRIGFGFSPPGWGVVECPGCKEDRPRRLYAQVSEEEFKATVEIQKGQSADPSDKDSVNNSKY